MPYTPALRNVRIYAGLRLSALTTKRTVRRALALSTRSALCALLINLSEWVVGVGRYRWVGRKEVSALAGVRFTTGHTLQSYLGP